MELKLQGKTYILDNLLQLYRPTLGLKGDPWL